jgi:hypothetical protein
MRVPVQRQLMLWTVAMLCCSCCGHTLSPEVISTQAGSDALCWNTSAPILQANSQMTGHDPEVGCATLHKQLSKTPEPSQFSLTLVPWSEVLPKAALQHVVNVTVYVCPSVLKEFQMITQHLFRDVHQAVIQPVIEPYPWLCPWLMESAAAVLQFFVFTAQALVCAALTLFFYIDVCHSGAEIPWTFKVIFAGPYAVSLLPAAYGVPVPSHTLLHKREPEAAPTELTAFQWPSWQGVVCARPSGVPRTRAA